VVNSRHSVVHSLSLIPARGLLVVAVAEREAGVIFNRPTS